MPGWTAEEGSWGGGGGVGGGPSGRWIRPELGGVAVVGGGLLRLMGAEREEGWGRK